MTREYSQQWEDILDRDDADQAKDLWRATLDERDKGHPIRIALLAQTLEHKPVPFAVLDTILKSVYTTENWLVSGAGRTNGADWHTILDWYGATRGTDALAREMVESLRECVVLHSETIWNSRQDSNGRIELANAILERDPSLVHAIEDVELAIWCSLAMAPSGGTWLARSGLDVERVIYEGIHQLVDEKTLTVSRGKQEPSRLEQWLARHDDFRQAWKNVQARDCDRMARQQQWFEYWIGSDVKNSRLVQWLRANDFSTTTEHPFSHAVFEQDWPTMALGEEKIREYANLYASALKWPNGNTPEENTQLTNLKISEDMHDYRGWWILPSPTQPLLYSFCVKDEAAIQAAETPEGAAIIQKGLAGDLRVRGALAELRMGQLLDWCLKEDSWAAWRDSKGNSVLGLFLDEVRARNTNGKGKVAVPKAPLLRLAKKVPDLFREPNVRGERLLDQLPITDQVRVELNRVLLAQHAQSRPTERKGRTGGRRL